MKAADAPSSCLEKAQKALKLSESNEYQLGIAESLLNIGRCNIFIAEYQQSKEILTRSLERFRSLSDKKAELGEMRALNALGVVSFETQDYESALNYYFMVLTDSEQSKDNEMQVLALSNIGEIHRIIGNIEEALSYAHRAYQIALTTQIPNSVAVTNVNLGELYLNLKDYIEADEYFKKAFSLAEEHDLVQLKADALSGLGRILLQKEEFFGAEDKLMQAFNLYTEIGDKVRTAECNFQFGLMGLYNKKYSEAKKYFEKARLTAVELDNTELLSLCMKKLSEIAKSENNPAEALEFFEKYHELEEELRNDSLKNRLKKISILYETEQTETEKESYRMQSLALEKSNKEIKFINEIGQEITASLNLDNIIHNTYSRMTDVLNMTSFGIALYSEDLNEVEYTYIVENRERHAPISISMDSATSLTVWSIKNKKPVLISKRSDSEKYIKMWSHGGDTDDLTSSAIYMPMLHGKKMVGCLTVQNTSENAFTESDLNIVGAVSTFLAIALDNSRVHTEVNKLNEIITSEKKGLEVAYRKIAHMANHDALTDLPNRHLLNELLKRGTKIASREKQKLAVLYMDLDKFKPINDTLGHESGDIVLKTVAERLSETLRTSDTVARIGGDEFVAVLYNIDSDDGVKLASEKIIKIIGEEIKLKGRTFTIGISIGIAMYPSDDSEIEGLLLKADKAMYRAKQSGRNRAIFFADR